MGEQRVSWLLAVVVYGGLSWLFAQFNEQYGWMIGLAFAYFLRGTFREPLNRDGSPASITDTVEKRIQERLDRFPNKQLGAVLGAVGQFVGSVLVVAVMVAIVVQLPSACSGPTGEDSLEYRAR